MTVDYRWDCDEGINRWVIIFCIKMNIPAVSRGSGHQCGPVPRVQRCLDPALPHSQLPFQHV